MGTTQLAAALTGTNIAILLANDTNEPGIHLVAGAAGSRVRIANKDGRERLIVP